MKIQRLEKLANEAAEILAPKFSSAYELKIKAPRIKVPKRWYSKKAEGYFFAEGKLGHITLNKTACREREECGRIVSHETGHSATWQYNQWYFNVPKTNPEYNAYNCMCEGIAMHFEKRGIEELLKEGWLTETLFKKARETVIGSCNNKNDAYKIGYSIIMHLTLKTTMKEIIQAPRQFLEEIQDIFGKDIEKYGRQV